MKFYIFTGISTVNHTQGYMYRLLGCHNETGEVAIATNSGEIYYMRLMEFRNSFVKMEKLAA